MVKAFAFASLVLMGVGPLKAEVWVFGIEERGYANSNLVIVGDEAEANDRLQGSLFDNGRGKVVARCKNGGWYAWLQTGGYDDERSKGYFFAGACGKKSKEEALKATAQSCRRKPECSYYMNKSDGFALLQFGDESNGHVANFQTCDDQDRQRLTRRCTNGAPSREETVYSSFSRVEFMQTYGK